MDRYLTASETRAKLLQLIDHVAEGDQVVVTHRGAPKAVLIGFEQLETLRSVARLWQDPEAMRAIRAASDDVAKGRVLRAKKVPRVRDLLARARKQGLLSG
jgi:prevent-host-death family protein